MKKLQISANVCIETLFRVCYASLRSVLNLRRRALANIYAVVLLVFPAKKEEEALGAALAYRDAIRRLKKICDKFQQFSPQTPLAVVLDLRDVGLEFDKSLTRKLTKSILRYALRHRVGLEIYAGSETLLSDSLDIIKSLQRISNEFRLRIPVGWKGVEEFVLSLKKCGLMPGFRITNIPAILSNEDTRLGRAAELACWMRQQGYDDIICG